MGLNFWRHGMSGLAFIAFCIGVILFIYIPARSGVR